MRADYHLKEAEAALNAAFPEIRWGRVVPTRAENTVPESADYLNRAASFDTSLGEKEVRAVLKDIEKANGRKEGDKEKGTVPLDIDLLRYDSRMPKPQDLSKPYVRKALEAFPENREG